MLFFAVGLNQYNHWISQAIFPIFLSKKQIREDLNQSSRLFRDNYLRYPIFEHSGINWKAVFQKLESFLLKDINPF
ncbi:MAG: hypothetical protein Ct9H300mP28_14370 [Pseudomonadota bacterium]|nr:MAG: hypothetical protein Ct9H300mP28_14370 [Pseudomonadota bacterium]